MSVDEEEMRLRDAVVEAADAWGYSDQAETSPVAELALAIVALRDHRAKASAPVAPERCEPPEEFRSELYHWLDGPKGPVPARWNAEQEGVWVTYGGEMTPEKAVDLKLSYHSPAHPDIRKPVTDAAIIEFARQSDWLGTAQVSRVRELLAHFSAPAVEWSEEEIRTLARIHCSQYDVPGGDRFSFQGRTLYDFACAILAGKKP